MWAGFRGRGLLLGNVNELAAVQCAMATLQLEISSGTKYHMSKGQARQQERVRVGSSQIIMVDGVLGVYKLSTGINITSLIKCSVD